MSIQKVHACPGNLHQENKEVISNHSFNIENHRAERR